MKKAQLQIGESMLVIILLTIVGIITLVFFFRMSAEDYEIKIDEYQERNAVETAQLASKLFEVKCNKPGATSLCFDIYKIKALVKLREDENFENQFDDYYYDLFKTSKLEIIILDYTKLPLPVDEEYETYTIYNKKPPMITRGIPIILPTPIYDPVTDTNMFGLFKITRYAG